MPLEFSPNVEPRYYAKPNGFRCQIGVAAITSFPAASVVGAQATGSLTFSAQPLNGSSVTINGVQVLFTTTAGFGFAISSVLASTPSPIPLLSSGGVPMPFAPYGAPGLSVAIEPTLSATIANLYALLKGWPDPLWDSLHFRMQAGNSIRITHGVTGTGGNAVTLAASSSPASNCTVSGATLAGGTALTSGHAVLVEPGLHPTEIQYVWGICEASQAAGTATLYLSNGTLIHKVDALTWAAGPSLSGTQELPRLPFTNISPSQPLVVPPQTGLYAYGGTTQIVDLYAGPAGTY